ncbi:MAG: hypothetical protein ACLF0G_04605 [Candidatus Brocadiia bacterium]
MAGRCLPLAALLTGLALGAPEAAPPPDAIHVLEGADWTYAPAAPPPAPDRLPDDWTPVALPHRLGTEPCGIYRADVPVPMAWSGRGVTLVVRRRGATAWAWVNGQAAGVRAPSSCDLRLDVTQTLRPGRTNAVIVALAAPGTLERGGLEACWLEATGRVSVGRLAAVARPVAQGALVDVRASVHNHGFERFEGRLELALEPILPADRHPVWRKGTNLGLDPGDSQAFQQAFEVERPRLWRFDDPFLYRLTATLKERDGDTVSTRIRRVGIRSVAAEGGRWTMNGEWVRLAGIALQAPGATLLCPHPGQAGAALERLTRGAEPPLDELLALCDEQGIVALLDAPAGAADAPGWRETLRDLAAAAAQHPSVWGWVVCGEPLGYREALALLRDATPRLPVGRGPPELPRDARDFDFVLAAYDTRAVRPDNDRYNRRLDRLRDDAPGKAVVAIDRIDPARPGDVKSILDSLPRRRGEAARRWPIAMLFFQPRRDPALYTGIHRRLRPIRLKAPRHEAKPEKDKIKVKTRFEVTVDTPVASKMPCHSLGLYRVAWRAGGAASGTLEARPVLPRTIEGGGRSFRGEVQWQADGPGQVDFTAELQDAAARVLARSTHTLTLKRPAKDKAEVKAGPPRKPPPPQPDLPEPVPMAAVVHLDLPFNNDGIAWRAEPRDGDFSLCGRRSGESFIADLLPRAGALVELPTNPAVTFRFPGKDTGQRNNVVCDGQRLLAPPPPRAFHAAWFLGAAHDGSKAALVTIEYQDGTQQALLRLAEWRQKPAGRMVDVLRVPAYHTAGGEEKKGESGLVAWQLALDPRRKLVAIHLPRERAMHVFAVTLVRAEEPAPKEEAEP